eukprot:TRINITY_DN17682_c0_g1_i1.p1 TRINITY_DN17682_c0_g1~~TRINITY_DN17682_c0_g1_i1.p1  ORF type:complete len:644 (-),score=132.93 TRINITY_DN17682_c0_g1_i1:160-1929(-)
MPRCQDLPAKAFGSLETATRVFAVTHPWLGRWHPDPKGIHMEVLRAKLGKMKKQLILDEDDVVFFDYLCLPQVSTSGVDDRTSDEKRRFSVALSGDSMGRIYLTARVIVIDEVPKDAESSAQYLDRGWCFFESMIASMNTFPRELMWVDKKVKDEISRFRELAVEFRETGDISSIVTSFDKEVVGKKFANPKDQQLVRSFFTSLATSQRLVAAAVRGDAPEVASALEDGADPRSRNGQGLTALHAAAQNGRVAAMVVFLRKTDPSVASTKTMEGETPLQIAMQAGARECQLLIRHKLGEAIPLLIIRAIEGDEKGVHHLLEPPTIVGASPGLTKATDVSGNQTASSEMAKSLAVPISAAAPAAMARPPSDRALGKPLNKFGKAAIAAPGITKANSALASAGGVVSKAPASKVAKPAKVAVGGARSATPSGKARATLSRGTAMRSAARMVLEPASPPSSTPPPEPISPSRSPAAATAMVATEVAGADSVPGSPNGNPVNRASVAAAGDLGSVDAAQRVDASDDLGNTALYYAATLRFAVVAELLLRAKADPEAGNHEGDSPLAVAKRGGDTKLIDVLARRGSPVIVPGDC